MQPSSRIQEALYAAMLVLAASPELDDAEQLWVREFALRLIAEFVLLKSETATQLQALGEPTPEVRPPREGLVAESIS